MEGIDDYDNIDYTSGYTKITQLTSSLHITHMCHLQ